MPRLPLRPLAALYNLLPVDLQRLTLTVTHQRFLVGVVGIGVDGDGRILLARHRFGASAWRFLGGLMERGESGPVALAREIQEETGLIVEVGPLLGFSSTEGWAHLEVLYPYRVREPIPTAFGGELAALGVFAPHALPPMRRDHRQLLELHAGAAVAWALGPSAG